MMEILEGTPERAQNIKQWTDQDPIVSVSADRVPRDPKPELQPYWNREMK